MSAISSMPHADIVQSLQNALDEQASDWQLVLGESHHRMKNTLTLLGATVRRDFTRAGLRDLSLAVDRFERRIVAYGRLYQLLLLNEDLPTLQAGAFLEELSGALSEAV
jgi:two-component sensor histidine kinase